MNFTESKRFHRLKAQEIRENLIKRNFIRQYRNLPAGDSRKILFRFGRNHLHRGFDSRGISTVGNFVSEFAISEGVKSFNVAAFAAGGECKLLGNSFNADERNDDIAFQFLSEQANYDATVFDLRPLRIYLHTIDSGKQSGLQNVP